MASKNERYIRMLEGMVSEPKDCPYYREQEVLGYRRVICTKTIKTEMKICGTCKAEKGNKGQ